LSPGREVAGKITKTSYTNHRKAAHDRDPVDFGKRLQGYCLADSTVQHLRGEKRDMGVGGTNLGTSGWEKPTYQLLDPALGANKRCSNASLEKEIIHAQMRVPLRTVKSGKGKKIISWKGERGKVLNAIGKSTPKIRGGKTSRKGSGPEKNARARKGAGSSSGGKGPWSTAGTEKSKRQIVAPWEGKIT